MVPPNEDHRQILPSPSMEEAAHAIHRLRNHKLPEAEGITADLVKYTDNQLNQARRQLIFKGQRINV